MQDFERKHGLKGVSKEESDEMFKAEDEFLKGFIRRGKGESSS